MGQGAERAMGRGVGIAADDGHAGLGAALLGPDHVDDAVAHVAHGEELDPVVLDVPRQRLELQARLIVGDGVDPEALALGRHVVVGHRQSAVRPAHGAFRGPKSGERLRRGHLMDQVQVDIEDRLAVLLGDDVGVPDLVVESLAGHGRHVGRPTRVRLEPGAIRRNRLIVESGSQISILSGLRA